MTRMSYFNDNNQNAHVFCVLQIVVLSCFPIVVFYGIIIVKE